MSILPSFLRSLMLTICVSFVAPIALVTFLLGTLCGMGYIPGLETIGQAGATQLLDILAVFGSGSSLEGTMVIGVTCSLVGALFDAYASTMIRT
ncbi:hypothetical protein [Lyngbya aestuarii]|uniref:hypothetical protein n=1 Tax=Lyngbya aestuarii TaxID=118322 RepID=UPI00403D62EE